MNEVETKKYLITQVACLNSGVNSGTVVNAIKNKTRISESVKPRKKIDVSQEIVNKEILNLIPDKNVNYIPQEIVKIKITKEMYEELYKKYLKEMNEEHNLFIRKSFDTINLKKYEIVIVEERVEEKKAIEKRKITRKAFDSLLETKLMISKDKEAEKESFTKMLLERFDIEEEIRITDEAIEEKLKSLKIKSTLEEIRSALKNFSVDNSNEDILNLLNSETVNILEKMIEQSKLLD